MRWYIWTQSECWFTFRQLPINHRNQSIMGFNQNVNTDSNFSSSKVLGSSGPLSRTDIKVDILKPRHIETQAYWNPGVLKPRCIETQAYWNPGVLKHRRIETPAYWNTGVLKHRRIETPAYWNTGVLKHRRIETQA